MTTVELRSGEDVMAALERIRRLPTVVSVGVDQEAAGGRWRRVGVISLDEGLDAVPSAVCRAIGEGDFTIARVERYPTGLEVVLA